MQIMILFSLIVFYICVNITYQQTCDDKGLRKFDGDVARLLTLGNSGRRFPENKGRELKVYCNESHTLLSDIDKYRVNCLTNLPRQVAGILVYALRNTIKQYCKKDSQRLTELINSTPCVNAANTELTKCYNRFIDSIYGSKYANESKRIPHVCCEYYKIYPCFHEKSEKFSTCSYKKIEATSDFVRSIFNNVIDFVCGDYVEHSDKCDKLESPPKKRKTDKRTKSFALPLIEVFQSFPEVL